MPLKMNWSTVNFRDVRMKMLSCVAEQSLVTLHGCTVGGEDFPQQYDSYSQSYRS